MSRYNMILLTFTEKLVWFLRYGRDKQLSMNNLLDFNANLKYILSVNEYSYYYRQKYLFYMLINE